MLIQRSKTHENLHPSLDSSGLFSEINMPDFDFLEKKPIPKKNKRMHGHIEWSTVHSDWKRTYVIRSQNLHQPWMALAWLPIFVFSQTFWLHLEQARTFQHHWLQEYRGFWSTLFQFYTHVHLPHSLLPEQLQIFWRHHTKVWYGLDCQNSLLHKTIERTWALNTIFGGNSSKALLLRMSTFPLIFYLDMFEGETRQDVCAEGSKYLGFPPHFGPRDIQAFK